MKGAKCRIEIVVVAGLIVIAAGIVLGAYVTRYLPDRLVGLPETIVVGLLGFIGGRGMSAQQPVSPASGEEPKV